MHFNTLNCVDVAHECDGRTDGQTDRTAIAIARSNSIRRALKTAKLLNYINILSLPKYVTINLVERQSIDYTALGQRYSTE